MLETIFELSLQVNTTPENFDGIRLLNSYLELILRYLVYFYLPELSVNSNIREIITTKKNKSNTSDEVELLSVLTVSDFCEILKCNEPIRAQPYNTSCTKTVQLNNEDIDVLLSKISGLVQSYSNRWTTDQTLDYSSTLLSLIKCWKSTTEYTVIPKGSCVSSFQQTRFVSEVTCNDDMGNEIKLQGVNPVLQVGDTVLLHSEDRDKVWAPNIKPLPYSAKWVMPHSTLKYYKKQNAREKIFISYSHEDMKWYNLLMKHLSPYIRYKKISVWTDKKISSGELWKDNIVDALNTCKVGVLLVSPNFLNSSFIAETELPALLKAARNAGLSLIWVLISPCAYDISGLNKFQAAHDVSKPINDFGDSEQDGLFVQICKKIYDAYDKA